MLNTLRRVFVFGVRHGFKLLLAFLILGYGLSLIRPGPAVAVPEDATVAKWKKVALSDVGLSERLMALETLRKIDSTDSTNALAEIAGKGQLPVASASCAALGRLKTSTSKGKLKGLLESSRLDVKVRMAAASCIAEHWKDRGDISYLRGNG